MNRKKAARVKRQAKSAARGSLQKSALSDGRALFSAEAEYADSIFQSSLGNAEASLAALRRSLSCKPDYAPALMSVGSADYQMGRRAKGRKLFLSLLSLPKNTPDIVTCIAVPGCDAPGTCYQRGVSSLQRLSRALFPQLVARYEGEFAQRLGEFRLKRITRAVERFAGCGDYRRGTVGSCPDAPSPLAQNPPPPTPRSAAFLPGSRGQVVHSSQRYPSAVASAD